MCLHKTIIGHFGQQIFFYGVKIRNFQVSKGPGNKCSKAGNECSMEQMFPGMNGLENKSSIMGMKSLENE